MSVWVCLGTAVLVAGLFSSPWISVLGACIIGSTPVWFTLRAALSAPRRPARRRHDHLGDDISRLIEQVPPGRPGARPDPHRRR